MKQISIISMCSYPLLKKIPSSQVGGAEVQLVTLGKNFAKNNYKVNFIVNDYGQSEIESIDKNIYAYKSPLRYLGGSKLYFFYDIFNLFMLLIKINSDFCILKLPNHLLLPVGIFSKLFKKKLIFICQIDRDVDLKILKTQVNLVDYLFYRIGIFFTDYIVTQSCDQKDKLMSWTRLKDDHVRVIKNIISLPVNDNFDNKINILWVGSNLSRKQPWLFIDIAQRCPDFKFKMIVSNNDKGLDIKPIEERCKEIQNLEYLGMVQFDQIGVHFQEAAVLISTSLLEGFPNVFLQAWQYKTPVISLNIDPDNVISKYNMGMCCDSVDSIVFALRKLMTNANLRIMQGENGYKYVVKNHSSQVILDQYFEIIN